MDLIIAKKIINNLKNIINNNQKILEPELKQRINNLAQITKLYKKDITNYIFKNPKIKAREIINLINKYGGIDSITIEELFLCSNKTAKKELEFLEKHNIIQKITKQKIDLIIDDNEIYYVLHPEYKKNIDNLEINKQLRLL